MYYSILQKSWCVQSFIYARWFILVSLLASKAVSNEIYKMFRLFCQATIIYDEDYQMWGRLYKKVIKVNYD